LQHFLRIFEEIAVLVALCAKHLGCELRGYLNSSNGTVFRHESNLIDLDGGFAGQRGFQLLPQRAGLGIAARKCAHKAGKLRLRGIWCEMDAGDAGSSQQLREAFFRGSRSQRHAVQQDLVSGGTEQQTSLSAFIERGAQFFPRSLKLSHGAHMTEFVQARKLQQDVQAADECPSGLSCIACHSLRTSLPTNLPLH
jgi:hypothetical protein